MPLSPFAKAVTRGKILAYCKVERYPNDILLAINRQSRYYVEFTELEEMLFELQKEGKLYQKRGTWCIHRK